MQRQHHTKGIILKKEQRSEFDYAVTLFSPELGKIKATAKGSRKITSSFCGHLETLNICNFQLYQTPYRFTILQCQTETNFKAIRADLQKSLFAMLLLEIFEKSTYSDEHGAELYQLLESTLTQINNGQQYFLEIEEFKLKLLNFMGVLPDIKNCSFCHKPWLQTNGQPNVWLNQDGHLSCDECSHKLIKPSKIDFSVIKLIAHLTFQDKPQKNIRMDSLQKNRLQQISNQFLNNYLDQEMRSPKVIAGLSNVDY
ncbi:MAG: DNA repair protein RecO [Candidatus Gracilibacteria bacterium]|jgi:DNA repair protein RecO (recombination protein O)